MVRELMHDPIFLAGKSEMATKEDLQVANDLLETLISHKESCVGMAANMIGVRKRIIAFLDESGRAPTYTVMLNPEIIKRDGIYKTEEGCLSLLGGPRKCKHVPFHALRHTFASNSFHYGMDVKMLANAIGHQSVETTMNVYAHATEEMQRAAARKIDEAIGKALGGDKPRAEPSGESGATDRPSRENAPEAKFEAYKGKKRKPGKGYVKQLSANCWQGRYTPTIDGKRVPMNIYAPTEKECEDKLAELVQEVQAERKAKKQSA